MPESPQLESGYRTDSVSTCSTPKNRVSFWTQIIIVYLIIIVAITHLSLRSPDKELWLVLLSSSLGYILPSPGLKFAKPRVPTSTLSIDEIDGRK